MSHLLGHILILIFFLVLLGSSLWLGGTLCAVCHEMRKNFRLLQQEIESSAAISFDFIVKFGLLFSGGAGCRLRGCLILPKCLLISYYLSSLNCPKAACGVFFAGVMAKI